MSGGWSTQVTGPDGEPVDHELNSPDRSAGSLAMTNPDTTSTNDVMPSIASMEADVDIQASMSSALLNRRLIVLVAADTQRMQQVTVMLHPRNALLLAEQIIELVKETTR